MIAKNCFLLYNPTDVEGDGLFRDPSSEPVTVQDRLEEKKPDHSGVSV